MRTAKLICVTSENNNKFYNMVENTDGSISVEYGRVGSTKQTEHYPVGKKSWEGIIRSKLKKGYQDITSLKTSSDQANNNNDIFKNITDTKVISLMKYLMECSKNIVKTNYLVTTDDVTKKQLEEAQKLIDETIQYLQVVKSVSSLNAILTKLYTVLPRKMKNVKHHLVDSLNTKYDVDDVRKLIDNEQSLLSTLESQVLANSQATDMSTNSKNILEEMGIEVSIETDQKMLDKINYFLGTNKQYCKNIYKVINHSTQKRFDDHLAKMSNKETMLLWHGSRNENWLGILQKGLMVRPANAIITGAMFGNGIYFANRSQKSLGYSSLSGSYWTGGNSNKGFLALFSVHTGNSKQIYKHDSSCYTLHNSITKQGFDSVFAHKGADLRNDEIITYDVEKSTISYIIEMEK